MIRPLRSIAAMIAPLMAALAFGAAAQTMEHSGHMTPEAAAAPSTAAYQAANAAMHEQMAIDYSGDADADFIRSMIPHHQGAVEMARIVLEHGTDPEVRTLAQAIVAAQESEIAWMKNWLATHGE